MRTKLFKKKLLLIVVFSVFIYYTFYLVLKTSGFSKINKKINEESIINTEAESDLKIDLKDSKNIGDENAEKLNINLYYDENENAEKENSNDNNVDNDNNMDVDNNMDSDSSKVDKDIEEHIDNNNNEEKNADNAINNQENVKSTKTFKKYPTELGYVLNYKGGEIEPEWDWIRNISIVYTWVDGSDIDFADEKAKYNGGIRATSSRDRSADELKYSLRSVEKYLPWHNGTIYILTHSQVPKWLDTTNPRIKMVYHKDIFPEHVYPTYDSATIEAFLDKIPGVTERFIYFNDDVFLNNYVHPCFFFTKDNFYPQIYRRFPVTLEKSEIDQIIAENQIHMIFTASKYYTRELARKYFDEDFEYCDLFHTPHVYYRDLMEPFRQLFHEEFKEIFSNRFRNGRKFVTQYLFQVYMQYATQHPEFPLKLGGKGKAKDFVGKPLSDKATLKHYAVKIVDGKVGDYLVKFGKITDNSKKNKRYFNYIKNHKALLVYNFNDAYTKESALHEFTDFMISQYPEPSSFETQEYKDLEAPFAQKIVQINEFLKELINGLIDTYSVKNLSSMKVMIITHRINISRDYVNERNRFNQEGRTISDREDEEIKALASYHGGSLSSEWEWAKKMSMVYIVSNSKESLKHEMYMEELKYSLRSVEKYLPWFEGKIYLISQSENKDGLSWVNDQHRNIEIIYYRDIVPKEFYRTNNKHVIEMYLDKIPGITEKFVYMKENHFFSHYTHPRFFFNKEFYPKYNFKDVIPVDKSMLEEQSTNSFIYTSKAIVQYFGDSYINTFRHNEETPFALYRDLFAPVRELFMPYLELMRSPIEYIDYKKMDILPMYLLENYNIYGTAQPFYPEYVAGYGYIKNAPLPTLNPERTVDYYGFDVTSPSVAEKTICAKTLSQDPLSNKHILQEIENTSANFFSLTAENPEDLDNNAQDIKELLNKLYGEKSSFENGEDEN